MKVLLIIICILYIVYRVSLHAYKTNILATAGSTRIIPFFVYLGEIVAAIIEGFCWYYVINQIIK